MIEQQRIMRRLLVLDDENDVAATICLMAATAGYETEHTDDIDFFIERLLVWSPTHVAVDLQLAKRDGIEVIHRLVKLDCKAAVIIISGLGGRILDSASRAASENGLRLLGTLSKPFSRDTFLDLLNVYTLSRTLPDQESSFIPSQLSVSGDQLANALRAKAFIAHFQPKISCLSGELVGFECLARWPLQGGGMIAPDVFIGLAEKTGLIHELTRQIYHYALANLPEKARKAQLKFALNLSPINLNDETFPPWLMEKCHEHNVAPSQIILEMTETASMDNPLELLERLTQFRIRGFHLSIDDFGVGYSSLVQLARLPFSELKIDQMFIKTLSTSDESRKIVTAVVGLGHSLGLNVVAEGVEDEWVLNFLHDIGCNEAQGYFIARPMSPDIATDWKGCSWRSES